MHESSERTGSWDVAFMENEAEGVSARKETGKQLCTLSNQEICAACQQNFHNREPMLLPCLHSLCKTCVPLPWRSLMVPDQPGASPVDQGSKPLNVIRCPVCRQEFMDVDVMENFFLRDSVEMSSSTVDKPFQLCMSCDDNTEASGFCEQCVEFLCVTCIDAHQRVKFTKDHHIRQQEELSQILGISTPKPVFCDVHKQEPLKLFCETCDRPTCRDCQLLKHKDHNYQFLEDAYRNHRQNMEEMICQLQEKRKSIEDISDSINNGIAKADENYTTVHNEIKTSMCSLILEINRKGKILLNQLETLTKDNRNSLRKQQQDVSSLSRHLDHVITFTKWATGHSGGTALLYCKRLILFQISNLLKTKCSTAFVPQSIVHFQCQAGYWTSNVELGSLMVENIQGPQLNGFQGIYPVNHLGQGYPVGLPPGTSQQPKPPHSTLAQLQMQVEKLAKQQPPTAPLAPPPHWSWSQSVPLPRPPSIRPPRSSAPQGFHPMPQQGRGFMPPHYHQMSPIGAMKSPGSPSQALQNLRGLVNSPGCPSKHMDVIQTRSALLYSHSAPLPTSDRLSSPLSLQERNDLAFSSPLLRPTFPQTTFIPGSVAPGYPNYCKPPYAHPDTETKVPVRTQQFSSAAKRRRHSSPGPIIIIKDEPDEKDDVRYMQCTMRPSLPDSTGDQGNRNSAHKDGSHHSTGVQTLVSQHKTPDWLLPAQPRSTEETSQVPQQGMTDQSSVLFQNCSKTSQHPEADEQTQASRPSPGYLSSSGGCYNDHTQKPQQSAEVQPKGHIESTSNPQPSQAPSGRHTTVNEPASAEDLSEDCCRVCQTGGELLCCDKCSKVYHSSCHIPPLPKSPRGQWFCTLCRDLYTPEMEYDSEILAETTMKNEASSIMKPVDKRKCERLLLQIYCSELSADFRLSLPSTFEPKQCYSSKTPVQLAVVKSKLESKHSSCYYSPAEFVSDVRVVFRNYSNFYEIQLLRLPQQAWRSSLRSS
ncbi:transcription intermediary factor 1-alpha-like isoform X2 [Clupea harengus]|uniref:RING-type E3 ubiquitin transferase n=1 Tax=Clupea harengus TaxID=7950 RepID=A0A6P8FA67_CLUHA|nr:transcription intermediary factor 1-alpha-like isoform X2 [Clupea harengus]